MISSFNANPTTIRYIPGKKAENLPEGILGIVPYFFSPTFPLLDVLFTRLLVFVSFPFSLLPVLSEFEWPLELKFDSSELLLLLLLLVPLESIVPVPLLLLLLLLWLFLWVSIVSICWLSLSVLFLNSYRSSNHQEEEEGGRRRKTENE